MNDTIYIVVMAAFFVGSALYAFFCETLEDK